MKKKTVYKWNTILLAILITFLCASDLVAQNKGENVMEGVAEAKLISAVLFKDIAEVERVLAEGVDINQQDGRGYTALIWACSFSSREAYFDVAKLLILTGADVNVQANNGNAAIIEAAGNSTELFNLLRSKGADTKVKKVDGSGAYFECMIGLVLKGRNTLLVVAKHLLSKGANVDETPVSGDLQGFTALMFAARGNKIDAVNFLIENGANVNAKNVNDDTPLSLAEEANNTEIIKILKANGATN